MVSDQGPLVPAARLWCFVLDRASTWALGVFGVLTLMVFFVLPFFGTSGRLVFLVAWVALLIALLVPMRTLIGDDGLELRHIFHPHGKFISYRLVRAILDDPRGMDVVFVDGTIAWRTVGILAHTMPYKRAELRERFAIWRALSAVKLPEIIPSGTEPYRAARLDDETLERVLRAPHAPLPMRIQVARQLLSSDAGRGEMIRAAACACASSETRASLLGVAGRSS